LIRKSLSRNKLAGPVIKCSSLVEGKFEIGDGCKQLQSTMDTESAAPIGQRRLMKESTKMKGL
jgi:hypothetical protein